MEPQRTRENALLEISRLQARHGVGDYNVFLTHRNGKKIAIASCNRFSKYFAFVEFYALHLKEEDFKSIMLHEIAHALTPGHKHDRVFRNMCMRIGGNPYATSNVSYLQDSIPTHLQTRKLYIYECPSCKKEFAAGRLWKNRKGCGICSPRKFDERFILRLKIINK